MHVLSRRRSRCSARCAGPVPLSDRTRGGFSMARRDRRIPSKLQRLNSGYPFVVSCSVPSPHPWASLLRGAPEALNGLGKARRLPGNKSRLSAARLSQLVGSEARYNADQDKDRKPARQQAIALRQELLRTARRPFLEDASTPGPPFQISNSPNVQAEPLR
jgi:hypothetical protein